MVPIDDPPAAEPPHGRSSANRERIVAVASAALVRDPTASLDEIARAAGVVRRTVYGHFSSREGLIEAVARASALELVNIVRAGRLAGDPPEEALTRLTLAAWRERSRYRTLLRLVQVQFGGSDTLRLLAPIHEVMVEILTSGSGSGAFSPVLPPAALATVVQATTIGLLDAIDVAEWDGDESAAAAVVLRTAGLADDRISEVIRSVRERDRRAGEGSSAAPRRR